MNVGTGSPGGMALTEPLLRYAGWISSAGVYPQPPALRAATPQPPLTPLARGQELREVCLGK